MKMFVRGIVAGVLVGAMSACGASGKSLWLLENPNGGWCAYGRQSSWERDAARLHPLVTVTVRKSENFEITVVTESESGDWIVYDTYRELGKTLYIQRIERNVSENLNIIDNYSVIEGGMILVSSSVSDLITGQSVNREIDRPGVDLHNNVTTLAFYPYFLDLSNVTEDQERCIDRPLS